jgi:PAS domain S-box-containing protein
MALRAVLVDDNPDDRALVARELAREFPGVALEHILDERGFVALLERGGFDLVVTDFQLRWSDGLRVLTDLKRRYPHVAVIMFTGTGSEEVAVEAMRAGVDEYVIKTPQRLALLRLAARSAVGKAANRAALAAAELRHRELFETVPVGLYRVDPDGMLTDVNPAFRLMFGIADAEDLAAASVQALFFPPSFDRDAWIASLAGGTVVNRQREVWHSSGETFWIEENVRAMVDAHGRIIAYDGVAIDVTSRREAELLLRAAKEDAEMATRTKTAFLSMMSHELRTPLNAVIGFSEMLQMQMLGPLGSPRYAEYVRDIHGSATHLLSLVNDLLDVTSIESGRRELHEELVSITRVIDDVLKIMQAAVTREQLTIVTRVPPNLPDVRADPLALRQVLLNLLSNAVKFTRPDGRIEVSADVDGDGRLAIAVHDSGTGIPAQDIPKVLSGAARLTNPYVRSREGAGLGLPITKSLVELHGGRISIDSQPGSGTNVRVVLPADRVMSATRH